MSRPPCENCNCARRKPTDYALEHSKAILRHEMAQPSITEQLRRGFIKLGADDDV